MHSATVQDRDGARLLLEGIQLEQPLLEKIWADGAYRGQLIAWVKQPTGIELEIVKRRDDLHSPPGPFEVGHSPRKAGVYEAVYKSEKNKQIKIYNNSYGTEVRSLKL